MRTAIRRRLALSSRDDRGFSLIEVIVAILIFGILSTGVLYGTITILHTARDSRAGEAASNLASEEIDTVRESDDDLSDVGNSTRTVTLNGDNFTIKRTANWVTDPDSTSACGSGGTNLQYKRVAVNVTWDNMTYASQAVNNYTIITPTSRINDPTKGTIIVSVLGLAGTGVSGATITATPTVAAGNTATAITTAPGVTDGNGCGFILKVNPGSYDVSVSKSGYISNVQATPPGSTSLQTTAPVSTVGVVAGSSAAAGFNLAQPSTFTLKYAGNYTATTPMIPKDMDTTFSSAVGPTILPGTGSAINPRIVAAYPYSSGYQIQAGELIPANGATAGCISPDAATWAAAKISGTQYSAGLRPSVSATAEGGSASVIVPMGVVTVSGLTALSGYIKAVSVDATPGCAADSAMTYTYSGVLTSTTATIALPYGTWLLYTGATSASQTTAVNGSRISILTGGASKVNSNQLVLDPRVVTP